MKILLVDNHSLFREGVRALLAHEADLEFAGEAIDAGEAVRKAAELRPDIVLMPVSMPGLSTLEAARQIRKNRPETKIVFLTLYDDDDQLVECMNAGAAGYILKDTQSAQLFTALRDIHRGGTYVDPRMLTQLVADYRAFSRSKSPKPRFATLTGREREILKLLAEGNSVKEAAALLNLSAKTIEAHKFNLMRKLDIHNKAQLVRYAFQKKIIQLHAIA